MITALETKEPQLNHYMACLKCSGRSEDGRFTAGTVEFPDDPLTLDKDTEVECQDCFARFKVSDFNVYR